jgi:hypothetical protein
VKKYYTIKEIGELYAILNEFEGKEKIDEVIVALNKETEKPKKETNDH